MSFAWMAWTMPTALFFATIAVLLVGMGVWERLRPGGAPRRGILRIKTHRGDRLFITLLGAAFIHLAWLGLVGHDVWAASILSLLYAAAVFRWV